VSPAIVKLQTAQAPAKPLDLNDLTLVGEQNLRVALRRATTAVTHEATLDGAGTVTITVRDPERGLLRSRLVMTKSTLVLDRVQYRLVKVTREGNALQLIFEETAANVLREYDEPRKAARDSVTRAQFVQSLVREPTEVVIPFRCPERDQQQPIARPEGA
jgi:hypothetical protein